jgi:uncharacterized protein
MTITYPLPALRALALHATRLDTPNGREPAPSLDSVYETVQHLGAVQIDTLQMVARAHYLTIWSRHGAYDQNLIDRLAFDPAERRVFEGWQHAACYIPTVEYRYQMPHQRSLRESPSDWYTRWLNEVHHKETVDFVRERIRREGALRVSDFERGDHPPGAWWNWRPAKVALEYLYAFGDLMIANRVKFQRVYDLTERILPEWADRTEPTAEQRDRFWLERGAKALGVSLPRNPADYTWMKLTKARPLLADLLRNGILREVQGETLKGVQTLLVHRDQVEVVGASGQRRNPPGADDFPESLRQPVVGAGA